MKKILIAATGTLALFASVTFYSCQKSETETNIKPNKTILMSASTEYEGFISFIT